MAGKSVARKGVGVRVPPQVPTGGMDLDEAIRVLERGCATYVLQGSGGEYLYKGACRDLCERLKDHRAGRVSRTKNRRPLRLVYCEYVEHYRDALRRERFLKSGKGRALLKHLLQAE